MAEKAYKEMSLEEANQLPAAILKQRWIEVHNATVNLYYLKNGRDIVMVEPSELECKIAGWRKALKYIGNHGHNARTSPAEKLREMIEDEIKRLTRPQVVQLELFSF